MPTNFPTSVQTFTAPAAADSMKDTAGVEHHTLHDTLADTLEAVQTRALEVLSLADYSPAADGTTDDAAKIESLIDAAVSSGKVAFIPAGEYAVSTVRRRSISGDLRVECSPGTVFVGLSTLQEFNGDDSTTSFVVTGFLAGFNGFRVATVISGVVTTLVEGTDYSVSAQTIDITGGSAPLGSLATGETLRVVSGNGMFEIGPASIGGASVDWRGGEFDASARGYIENLGTGSALVVYNTFRGSVRDAYFYASTDWSAASASGLGGDSGITTQSCSRFDISGCRFVGWSDLGVYITGGASGAASDDGNGIRVTGCSFELCQAGASAKRSAAGVMISGNYATKCLNGFSLLETSGLTGGSGVISSNRGEQIGRLFIDVRNASDVNVYGNTLVDIGFEPDGSTPTAATPTAIQFLGVTRGIVSGNLLSLSAWAATNSQRGIHVAATGGGTQSSRVHVSGNRIDGMATGISESGTGTGIVWTGNELTNCATPVSVLSARRWDYHSSNLVRDGIGSVQSSGSWTPVLLLTGITPSPLTYTAQYGRYVRFGNLVMAFCKIQFNATHSGSSANQLRITGLPFTSRNNSDQASPGVVSYWDNFTKPANLEQLVPKVPSNASYVRFDGLLTTGGPVVIDATNVPSATTCRWEFQVIYECAEEAQN